MHKMCTRLRRQHARNPALLPLSAIAAFLLISLLLFLLSARAPASPHHAATQTFLHASVLAHDNTQVDDGFAVAQAGITPPQPLSVRALAALRERLDGRVLVHDFEACITLRHMMKLVGEDREAGSRGGLGEADMDVDSYLAQLAQRVEEEEDTKRQQQQHEAAAAAASPQQSAQQDQAVTSEAEWRSKVEALQQQVRELQAQTLEAREAAAVDRSNAQDALSPPTRPVKRRRDDGGNDRRIKYSKIKQHPRGDAAAELDSQQQRVKALPVASELLPDVVVSPEEAIFEQQAAQQQAGQPAGIHPLPTTPTPVEAQPPDDESEEAVFVAGVQGGAAVTDAAEPAAEEAEEAEWGKRRWKKRWRDKERDRGKKQHDDDD